MNEIKLYWQKFFNLITHLTNRWWGQLVLIFLSLFIIWYPYLFGLKIIAELDATNISYPFFTFYQQAIKGGSDFLINPFILNGATSYDGNHI